MEIARRAGAPLPMFLTGEAGRLFCIYWPPQAPERSLDVLIVPPFAEEMNKTRRMLAVLARELSQDGIGVLSFDLFGTGDSEGDFGDANWSTWKTDLHTAYTWLKGTGSKRVVLVPVRAGALLASDFVRSWPIQIHGLVLWHPVRSGRQVVDYWVRLKAVSGRQSVSDVHKVLLNGSSIEVGGYRLSPELYRAMNDVLLEDGGSASSPQSLWILGGSSERDSQEVEEAARSWQSFGARVVLEHIHTEPYWTGKTVCVNERVLALTRRWLHEIAK